MLIKQGHAAGAASPGRAPYPCAIGVAGMEERMLNALDFLLKTKMNGRFVLTEVGQADVLIIDLDSHGGRDRWAEYAETHPTRPKILLSMREVETYGATHFVRKPMRPHELIAALTAAASEVGQAPAAETPADESTPITTLEGRAPKPTTTMDAPRQPSTEPPVREATRSTPASQRACSIASGNIGLKLAEHDAKTFIGSVPDIDPGDPRQVVQAQFDPSAYLSGRLLETVHRARQANRAARLELEHGTITVMPSTGQAMIDLQGVQLRSLAGIPLAEKKTKVRLLPDLEASGTATEERWELEALLWNLALLAARGRVPMGTDLDAEFRLTRWPNLTRLALFPHAVRIAALLAREPLSLVAAAQVLRIPQRFVFAFYTAADAIDLMEHARHASPQGGAARQGVNGTAKASSKRGLLLRILSHLRL